MSSMLLYAKGDVALTVAVNDSSCQYNAHAILGISLLDQILVGSKTNQVRTFLVIGIAEAVGRREFGSRWDSLI